MKCRSNYAALSDRRAWRWSPVLSRGAGLGVGDGPRIRGTSAWISWPVAEGIYVLYGRGGNIGVSVGEDGVLLIDDQFAYMTPKIRTAVATVSDRPHTYGAEYALARRSYGRQRSAGA